MRLKASAIALGIATALVLTGCSSSGGNDDDSTTSSGGGAALTIAKPDGAIATESNNPWIGDSSALKLGYVNAIYEPVGIVNVVDPSDEVRPWLASEITWSDDYTSVTLTTREGVKWSDGQDLTADDIAYSYQMLVDTPELNTAALDITDVAVDGDTVTVSFGTPMFAKQDKVLHRFVVPKHVWEGIADPTTETNPDPVGTGPYTLTSFSTESVQLDARDDYWGGELAVPTLYYVSYNDNSALTTALANGDADWAQAFLPNVQSAFVDKDPEHNVYWAPAGLGIDAMFVNTTKKPFDDVAFRQAVNMVIDREQHQQIAREGGVPLLTSVTGLPTPAGDPFISDEYAGEEYEVDVDGAKKVLTDAGYTFQGDSLVDPDGEPVTFRLSVPQGWNDYVTGISLIAESVKAIGVEATVDTPDSDSWWAAKGTGDFDAILHWTETGATPYDIYSDTMDARWLKPVGEAADYNFGRFDSPEATAALDAYLAATTDEDRATAIAEAQKIFVEQVPVMPIGTRPFITEFNTRSYVGWPSDDDPYINADPTQPTAVLILTQLKPAE
ncbi:peptide/nickel transport system substrate-binding protein [Cellulosimicrobium aquatile]|uniref:Peptide/nickel transport system substrate-binding protein n=1 Tax=Cellulosimicrobium aquatile TaxID=1612203 RepID=A0A1N6QJB9_9MICO|nr:MULTISPECIES: ABC transporter substrate-binding protein [Cellulosimicrobium]MCM3534051.1 ABC transporter substrate-binding protein [Cellulosimicrobium funkei]NMF28774.1 ABC transporter substrate-binding protein [Cellulosimicrobium aquatile]SIQ16667.1 peptide/nickel transport system substrate-binding protein [Cellulosimicrobium aquatile]